MSGAGPGPAPDWDLPEAFVHPESVGGGDIDELGHANNAVYVQWLTRAAWAHSVSLGVGPGVFRELGQGMAIRRHEIDFLASAYAGDEVLVGTWITEFDGRLTMARRFQVVRVGDVRTLLRARTEFACIDLGSGRARRMPGLFIERYGPAVVR